MPCRRSPVAQRRLKQRSRKPEQGQRAVQLQRPNSRAAWSGEAEIQKWRSAMRRDVERGADSAPAAKNAWRRGIHWDHTSAAGSHSPWRARPIRAAAPSLSKKRDHGTYSSITLAGRCAVVKTAVSRALRLAGTAVMRFSGAQLELAVVSARNAWRVSAHARSPPRRSKAVARTIRD